MLDQNPYGNFKIENKTQTLFTNTLTSSKKDC